MTDSAATRVDVALRSTATKIVEQREGVPTQFSLSQNYPNPFNPTTVIPFRSDGSYVEIKVYDMVGREITTLAEGVYARGEHQVIFNASGLPAGRYFYRLTNRGTQQVKSMTYVK